MKSVSIAIAGWLLASPAISDVPGTVRLPLDHYDALLTAAEPDPPVPSVEPSVRQAQYRLEVTRDTVRLETTLDVVRIGRQRLPLALPDVGPIYALEVESGAARLLRESNGRFALDLVRDGFSRVRLRSTPLRQTSGNLAEISWQVPDVSAAALSARLPVGCTGLPIETGDGRWTSSAEGGQELHGTLERGQTVHIRYSTGEIAREPEEKLLAMVSEARLVELDSDRFRMVARLSLDVLRGRLTELALGLPEGLDLLGAEAAGHTVTTVRTEADAQRHSVRIEPPAGAGRLEMYVTFGGELPDNGAWTVPELTYPDLTRSESWLAISARRPLLIDAAAETGWTQVDESDLPDSLRAAASSIVLWSGRRSAPEAELALAVSHFPDAAALEGIVHRASALSVLGEDGRRIDRLTLELETRLPLLRFPIPTSAEVWSVQLDGKPVQPYREGGSLLVALGRGRRALATRRLDLVLAREPEAALPQKGSLALSALPAPFPITRLEWDLLVPESSDYRLAGGSLERRVWRGYPRAASAQPASAQRVPANFRAPSAWGIVRGRVMDETNQPLPGVAVSLSGEGLMGTRSVWTELDGSFEFRQAPAGPIALEGALDGFNPVRAEMVLEPNTELTRNLQLRLQSEQVEVTVVAEAPVVDMSSTETGTTITREMMGALPMGRHLASPTKSASPPTPATPPPPPLSDSEREALLSHRDAGSATVAISLPEGGKRLSFRGDLLAADEEARVELDVRPHRKKWWN